MTFCKTWKLLLISSGIQGSNTAAPFFVAATVLFFSSALVVLFTLFVLSFGVVAKHPVRLVMTL